MSGLDIAALLGADVACSGQALVDAGQVLETREPQPGAVITGVVEDQGRQRVYIQLSDGEIDGECSCDVGENCAHVAAVLLARQAPPGSAAAPEPTISTAASPSVRTSPSQTSSAMGAQQILLYSFKLSSLTRSAIAREATASLQVWVQQPSGQRSAFEFNTIRGGHYPRYVQDIDRTILRRLMAEGARQPLELTGTTGFELLNSCLATGRTQLQSAEGRELPASVMEARDPRDPLWQLLADGSQQLALDDSRSVIANLVPPLLVDTGSGHCCVAESLSDSLLALATREPITPEQAVGLPAGPLPKPLPLEPTLTERKSLSPVLRLHGYRHSADEDVKAVANLDWCYNGYVIDTDQLPATQNWVRFVGEDQQIHQVARDLEAEKTWRDQLKDFQVNPRGLSLPGQRAWLTFVMLGQESLQRAGWQIDIDDSFPYKMAEARDWYGNLMSKPLAQGSEDHQDWFNLELGVIVDGEPVNILPLLIEQFRHFSFSASREGRSQQNLEAQQASEQQVNEQLMLFLGDGRYLPIPLQRVQNILHTLVELYDQESEELSLPAEQTALLAKLGQVFEEDELQWSADDALEALAHRLAVFEGIEPMLPPPDFKAELRPYQQEGLGWLQFLREFHAGGILADDMGLGKTVQTLAHLATEKAAGRLAQPCLIVAPTSLMGNWRQEARKFAPDLKVLTLHGAKRKASFIDIPTADIVLTTYALLHFDAEQLLQQEYEFLILDEAQTIKNPRAKASQIVRQIDAQHRLCLTGTPMENHLTDLWSLFDFLQPGLLGKERHFLQQYRQPIERDGNEERALQLSQRIAPFILRRTKSLVASDLPPKTEIVRSIPLEQKQRDLYDSIRLTMHKQIRKAVEDQGFARSHIAVLDALLKLRQACCDPRLLDLDAAREVEDSAKFDALMQMLPELVEEGRRILVFSQFTSMLALIEQAVQALEIPCLKLTGQSQNRAEMVEKFQSGDIPVFLISLKAGGTGLNLTAADTVIHYDPWWNPAAENQATDRAYRIGQDKPVFVYKLITEGTVEEKILQLQHRKRELADGLYSAKAGSPTQLTQDDLNILLQPIDETPTDNTQSHD